MNITTYPTDTRRCPSCETVKPIDAFGVLRSHPSGRRPICRDCLNDRQRAFRATPEGKAANVLGWRRSTARALIRAGRPDDARKVYPDLNSL